MSKLLERQAEAEASVLSAWFYDRKFQAAWVPVPGLFVMATHRAIAEVCAARGAGLSDTSLVLDLKRRDKLKLFEGGAEGVTAVIHGTPTELDPWKALERLRELNGLAALREGITKALAGIEQGKGLSGVQDLVSDALTAAASCRGSSAMSVQGLLAIALEHATRLDKQRGCSVGNDALDRSTGGVRPESVWVFGADTSWGKSSWEVMVADINLTAKKRVLVVSCEDAPLLFGNRLLARRTQTSFWRLRDAELRPDEISVATTAVANAEQEPFYIDGRGRPVEQLASDIRSVVTAEGIHLVFVDYLQCMRTEKAIDRRNNEVAYVARVATDAIKMSGAGGVLFTQITVDPTKKHPDKHSPKESKDVSNAAETALFGYLEEQAGAAVAAEPRRMIFLDKNKDGPRGFHTEQRWNNNWAGFVAESEVRQQDLYDDERYG